MANIDLSALDRLTAPQTARKGDFNGGEGNYTHRVKNAVQGKSTPLQAKRYPRLEAEREERERAAAVYREYQENIKKADRLIVEINKGLAAGTDESALLLMALEAISSMTGNSLLYEQGKAEIKKRHEKSGG